MRIATSAATSPRQSGIQLRRHRLLVAVPESADVAPQIVIDDLGAGLGQRVLISSDGSEARKILGDELSPGRWTVCGIIDPERIAL